MCELYWLLVVNTQNSNRYETLHLILGTTHKRILFINDGKLCIHLLPVEQNTHHSVLQLPPFFLMLSCVASLLLSVFSFLLQLHVQQELEHKTLWHTFTYFHQFGDDVIPFLTESNAEFFHSFAKIIDTCCDMIRMTEITTGRRDGISEKVHLL